MSYYTENCLNQFSIQQVYAMKNSLAGALSRVVASLPTPIVSGNTNVCSSATYNCSSIPPGYSLTNWSSTNTAIATVSGGGTVSKVANGQISVAATLAQGCTYLYPSKTISVGTPGTLTGTYSYGTFTYPVNNPSTGISVSNSTPNITIRLLQNDPSATFNWVTTSSNGNTSFSSNGGNASVYLTGGAYRNIICAAVNVCGNGPSSSFNCYNYSGSFRLAAFPNPATVDLNVTAEEVLTEQEAIDLLKSNQLLVTDDLKKIDLLLYDTNGSVVLNGKITDKKLKLNTQKLPNGIYYLHAVGENTTIKQQIRIQH
ncbi:T9SS type A sorting domain-containing protein [Fibrella aquatilis]|uniref:T9SS type A sorting domain-containing protein n=1 Tax=Fibrella aquatilis TaxID=2817059 RepID=A0A939K246_9BACT|nr:T9SS type A sorting domain-containing protein [Fibrella aquatilis]MBO0934178.1 T9SS type A sorting domain-containing protein [Fibrella aquatilis]